MWSCFRTEFLAIFFSAHLIFAQAQAPNQVAAITAALRSGQFNRALELLQPELKQNPRSPQLWTLDGIALSSKGNKKSGLEAFRHALTVSPDYLPALEGAAQIEYENDDRQAAAHLQHILQLRPNEQTSHAMLAVLDYRRGDCAAAIPHFEQSLALTESQPDSLQAYGSCLVHSKQTDKAIALFTHALEQSNGDAQIRYRLASVQLIAQKPKDAVATLQPLLQENSTDSEALDLASAAYEADGNTPEAVRVLRQAIVVDPHNVNLYLDFANICLDHQSFDAGVAMMNAGLNAEPDKAPLYVARGILYVQMAQYDKAEVDFEKANAIDPRQAIGSAAEGLAAVQANDPERALVTVRAKLAKRPDDPFLLYLKANILTQRGPAPGSVEFREAMDAAKKSIALHPSLAATHDVLAKLYTQAGQNDAAIQQSRKALGLDPKDQTALYHLIMASRKSGHEQELPKLLKQLADLRMAGTKEEAERNRYRLVADRPVDEKSPSVEKTQP